MTTTFQHCREPLRTTLMRTITIALVIAGLKGSMVAGVFMHLSHERRWIYGALILTFAFFFVLLFLPLLTSLDGLGTGSPWSH